MNFQQLEYITAVDTHRHFAKAAKSCFVTQATLSMMIQKLEDEMGVKIFDRSKHPVMPTEIGTKVITQARRVLLEAGRMKELVKEEMDTVSGELKLGIIPTLAPYLLPLFLQQFSTTYPKVKLIIHEHTTSTIIEKLKTGLLDAALLATPLNDNSIIETPLFYEKYFLYVPKNEKDYNKQYILPKNIDVNKLWLLEEGHCMRSQILNLCELKKQHGAEETLHYEAGSIETLKNMVDKNFGITIIPELATHNLSAAHKKQLRLFKPPAPVRQISIVTHREYIKVQLIKVLQQAILNIIPANMKLNKKINVLSI